LFKRITCRHFVYRKSTKDNNSLLELSNCETKCYSIRRLLCQLETYIDRLITRTINRFDKKELKDVSNYRSNVDLYLIENNFFVTIIYKNKFVNLIDKNYDIAINNKCNNRNQLAKDFHNKRLLKQECSYWDKNILIKEKRVVSNFAKKLSCRDFDNK